MGKEKNEKPIHLSNKTAISLRHNANQVRRAWLVAMGVMTMIIVVITAYVSFIWLPAVLLTLILGAAVLALMFLASRCQYLMLVSQAICTESAYRQIKEQRSEQTRRRKAIEQLAAMHADVRDAMREGRKGEGGTESILFDLLTGRVESDEEIRDRRRREEDDEMYAESYEEEEASDDDLYPPRKSKQQPKAQSASFAMGSTKPIVRPVPVTAPVLAPDPDAANVPQHEAGETTHRRRRRSAPSASLQILRGEQAK